MIRNEISKIVKSPYMWGVLLFCILINCGILCFENTEDFSSSQYKKVWQQFLSEEKNLQDEIASSKDKAEKYKQNEMTDKEKLYVRFAKELEAVSTYNDYRQRIQENAKKITLFSTFTEGGFAEKNIEKTAQEAADIIGRVYGRRYLPRPGTASVIGHRWEMLSFEEDVRYRTIIGDARMVRMGEAVSGDSFTVMHMESGQTVLSLSDGMGSGEKAEKESNRIIGLLEQLLSTGFNRQSAIRLIHSVVLSGSEPHTYSTLDLATLDLFNGKCELIKMGAAASFIKNGPDVKKITSEALPPGVLPEPENEVKTAEMVHGDMLVMMSDGVLMGLGQDDDRNEEKMAEFLKSCQAVNPQELANAILNHAMAACHYEAEDDMTVLVCGLYRKPKL